MPRIRFIILVTFPFFVATALAHGNLYFEFAPDGGQIISVAAVQTPAQPFYPPNDFVDGADVWLDNAGLPGTASFGVRDSNNILLTSKTVSIPTINPTYGGTRFHIDFNNQVQVSGANSYKLRVISSMPYLRLYNAAQFQVLQHNSQNIPYFQVEKAFLGASEQDFAFKFALYESQETAPPVVSNINAYATYPYAEKIDFNANEPVDFKIEYAPVGQTSKSETNYSGTYAYCQINYPPCSISINVEPNTNYAFTLFTKDEWGNQATAFGNFVAPDVTQSPPPQSSGSPTPTPPIGASPTPTTSSSPTPTPSNPTITPTPSGTPAETPGLTTPTANPEEQNPSPTSYPNPGGAPGVGQIYYSPTAEQIAQATEATITQISENGDDAFIVSWDKPLTEPKTGYRIDVFDENQNLTQQFFIESGARQIKIKDLYPGTFKIFIYANNDGAFELIAKAVIIKASALPFFGKYRGGTAIFAGLIALVISIAVTVPLLIILKKRSSNLTSTPATKQSGTG